MQNVWQQYIDGSVSKTINMDSKVMGWDEFKGIYKGAWEKGAKGCTTFNQDGKKMALLKSVSGLEPSESCTIDPETGARSCE